ncbi:MAG: helix-turn-helix domain-containing protein [Candidatus Thorarchaeota archaeon]
MNSEDPRKSILEALRKHPEGLTLLSLAKVTGLHRHTVTKYVHELLGAGIIFQRTVGVAKLCYLKEKIENQSDEKKILDKLKERRIGKKSQIKIISIVMIVTFLLSETAILAYQNTSLFNSTNLSNFTTINTSPLTSSNYPNRSPNAASIVNINIVENINLSIINISTEKNVSEQNLSVENSNETVPEINETLNKIEPENKSVIDSNFTVPIIPNETAEIPEKTPINLEIKLDYPKKITRGKVITAKASLVNNDFSTARNVIIIWKLPDGFKIVSGNENEFCGILEPNDACFSEISLKTDVSTVLGMNEIKVVASYEA